MKTEEQIRERLALYEKDYADLFNEDMYENSLALIQLDAMMTELDWMLDDS